MHRMYITFQFSKCYVMQHQPKTCIMNIEQHVHMKWRLCCCGCHYSSPFGSCLTRQSRECVRLTVAT